MKSLFTTIVVLSMSICAFGQAVITAVFDGDLPGGTPKGVEIYLLEDIADLSSLGVSSANNGTGSTGAPEFVLPAVSGSEGDYIYVASDSTSFEAFFDFFPDYVDDAANINGDDAMELFWNGSVIDVFGDVDMSGSGEPWDYMDSWAARESGTGPDGSSFELGNWYFGGPGALDGETSNASADDPVPVQTYGSGGPQADHTVEVVSNQFIDPLLVIDQGDLVEWNCTDGTHNVNGSQAAYPNNTEDFGSGPAAPAPWTYEFRFTEAGYNDYHCDPHLSVGMTGAIMVRESGDHYISLENNQFVPADITIEAGETVVWTNVTDFHNVNGTTATFPDNPEGFGNGPAAENWTWSYTFGEAGTYEYQCDPHAGVGMTGSITVESPYTMVTIPEVRENDVDGVSVLIGEDVEVSGVVLGPNFRPGGLEFFFVDGENIGLGVFSGGDDLGYTVNEGDEITIRGRVGQFNGLTQISPDDIEVVSTGNDLVDPKVVDVPSEEAEASFTQISSDLTLVDGEAWPDQGNTDNVLVSDGTDTITVRIDGDLNMDLSDVGSTFNVRGIGSQFDNSSPYNDGYQILPRSADDIGVLSAVRDLATLGIEAPYPNPTSDWIHIEGGSIMNRIEVIDIAGRSIQVIHPKARQADLDLRHLPAGTYILGISTEQGQGRTSFVKQ